MAEDIMMIKIPQQTMQQFETRLKKEKIPSDKHNSYKKWLRYYLDCCHKYNQHHQISKSLLNFIKLRDKNNLNSNKSMPLFSIWRRKCKNYLVIAYTN